MTFWYTRDDYGSRVPDYNVVNLADGDFFSFQDRQPGRVRARYMRVGATQVCLTYLVIFSSVLELGAHGSSKSPVRKCFLSLFVQKLDDLYM